ncbi:MAG: hypothetical protein OEY89_00210 [Gammaproteobacteria bacterium]|nr:hypothetical protein [Gammaproteobacteria bacterium]
MKVRSFALSLILSLLSMNCGASTIFNISGLENLQWLELTPTVYMSRESVEAEFLAGGAFEGWRYATRGEVETLYDSLWGGTTEGYSRDNYAGARQFFDAFGISTHYGVDGYDTYGYSRWGTIFGDQFECDSLSTMSCFGQVSIYDINFGAVSNLGYFSDAYGLSSGLDMINIQDVISISTGYTNVGSHLVRVVPLPAAVWLFCGGFLMLLGFSKKRNAY